MLIFTNKNKKVCKFNQSKYKIKSAILEIRIYLEIMEE